LRITELQFLVFKLMFLLVALAVISLLLQWRRYLFWLRVAILPVCLTLAFPVGTRNGRHGNKIASMSEKGRKIRSERLVFPYLQANCRRYHLLFGNVHFKVAVPISFGKILGVSGITDFPVNRNYIRSGCSQCSECFAVRVPIALTTL
jgi:hypothetical protein